ncbi:hypothetical protein SI65_01711 [Aspergillus cristatus]|uniref:SET domain-containing protein n=1 Tax=Aspergillus cristatus TaxID=573508 RepID=A0A1E3BTN0_ASPCR|nr:hypothetical protein SI65_01711 [Aspergillus cristatus]
MDILQAHSEKTSQLYADSHNPHRHLSRGLINHQLGFSDLAAADAYRALSLLESVVDPDGCEFHARRVDASRTEKDDDEHEDDGVPITQEEYDQIIGDVYALLVRSLVDVGCFRDAFDFCTRGLEELRAKSDDKNVKVLEEQMGVIRKAYVERTKRDDAEIDASALPAQGFARRVLYPWNKHEPDRKAPEELNLLNERLKDVAPKCEVRAVALPVLHGDKQNPEGKTEGEEVSIQLGLFAKEDIPAGDIILRESSMLTATNRLHDDLCDACNAPLPSLESTSTDSGPVPCQGCDDTDTIFCSQACHDQAQETYHGAVCGLLEGLESIGKDIPDPKDKADYLYLLLLGRAVAMAATQEKHPLDLPEVKYIWGDFHDYNPVNPAQVSDEEKSLPFSFHLNILQPMRIIEEMTLDPYVTLPTYDTWVLNTLYAKFRGTASGRLSTWDGGPELCAVHPLWCLANHSCDPNVRWEWGGEITFSVREVGKRALWKPAKPETEAGDGEGKFDGIRKDQEILNHYCDIGLDVKERREWARGALGGMCLCSRCMWEAGS